jgi:hypothetical protein
MAAYGDPGPISAYEYDHLVPLELGGAVNDPRNLWPEPGVSPNPKDAVEDALREQVCDGQMTLAQAQRAIASDWVRLASGGLGPSPSSPAPAGGAARQSGAPAAGAQCSASASYNSRYHDYDVYVHSDQPEQTATVSDGTGHLARWHTDETGYADVYFRAPAGAAGETINVRVGGASCQATLIP